ncbi:uncharacterized protein LOC141601910 [Silene latifolia]|uniref:uncharacterized protein LOC141601910 n=1 Tax=Silene latifolia TaxID=37657 RepID=UPI003D7711FA
MKCLAWNCRGLNDPLAPAIAKIRALITSSMYDMLFFSETKCSSATVSSLFGRFGFVNSEGVDALDAKGGLWVGWKASWNISCIVKCQNYVILKINICPISFWYLCCVYGQPKKEKRVGVWLELEHHLGLLDSHFVLVGDFNQVDDNEDKLGGSTGTIFGAQFFLEWKGRNLLSDIAFKGPKFTWCNNRKGVARVYERLDKGLASLTWSSHFPNTGILHLPIQCSDHAPIILDTEMLSTQRRFHFKLESWCFAYDECLDILKNEWFKRDKGSPSFKLLRKLKRIRGAFKQWTFCKRKEWTQKWTDFDEKLSIELQQIFDGGDEGAYENYHANLLEFNKAAMLFWKQRAKLNWLKDGDACTKYFFNCVRERHKQNQIFGIQRQDGNWTFQDTDIHLSFELYFKNIFESGIVHESFASFLETSRSIFAKLWFKLNSDQHDVMAKPFTRKEVRKAVFQMGSNKSPGPDGIPGLFYQKYWFYIKQEVTAAVLSMLNTGNILRAHNRTSITLIPKTNSPEKVEHYRPISLCNVIMRIVSKCISNRLKVFMPQLVGEFQNGFIPGRSIMDNVLISHELFHHINKKTVGKKGVMAIKVDMSKAYDRLRWNFIEATLLFMGFPHHIIRLIMNCIKTVSYEILINGNPGNAFLPKSGIRQGDPLSPYLFALCTEVLSQLLLDAEESHRITGVKICRESPSISHLLFADDSIFFMRADTRQCHQLRDTLDLFCRHSGQQINNSKSAVTFSPNCNLRTVTKCLKILNISSGKEMGLYLGLPTEFGSSKKEIFASIINKVCKRIFSWKNAFLSAAGRLTLICSVLSSLSLYSLSAFKMPVSVSSKIDSLISQFWWGGNQVGNGIHWCSKLFTHSSKVNGGLGIRNVGCVNQSLLAKIGWKIISNTDCLLSRVLGSKYRITKGNVMNPSFVMNGSFSWGGRGIKWGLELLKDNLAWQIGFPSSLDIWRDKWIHGASLAHMLSLNPSELLLKPCLLVSLLQTQSGDWDHEKVLLLCGPDVLPFVLSTPIPLADEADQVYWTLTSSGNYSTKSGYALAFSKLWNANATAKDKSRMVASSIVFCRKRLWSLPIPNKWRIFLWKILANSLPCGEEARKRNFQWYCYCQTCSATSEILESLDHLFRDCPLASRIWAASTLGIRTSVGSNIPIQQWVLNWLNLLSKSPTPTLSISFFVSTLWHIWCARNRLIFHDTPTDYYDLLNRISRDAHNNVQVEKERGSVMIDIVPSAPEEMQISALLRNHFPICLIGSVICSEHIRLKCDASWKSTMRATAGWFFKTNNGVLCNVGKSSFWAKTPLQAEAIALMTACRDAISLGYRHIDATSDCLNLVLQLNGGATIDCAIAPILRSLLSLLSSCHCFSLSHCPRSLNGIAHGIATAIP